MNIYIIFLALSVLGIVETIYLIIERKRARPPVCVIGESCRLVLKSKYNSILGIHNDVYGFVFYLMILIISLLLIFNYESWEWLGSAIKLLIILGVVQSFIFVYLQWRVIKAWCFWCLTSAVIIFLMFVAVIAEYIL